MDVVTLGAAKADARRRYPPKVRALLTPRTTLLTAMASPPTIGTPTSYGAHGTYETFGSTLTSPIAYPLYTSGVFANGINTVRFRQFGWPLGNNFNTGKPVNPGYSGGSYPSAVEFMHYGTAFELRFVSASSGVQPFQLYVDDQPISSTVALTSTLSAGVGYLLPITFSGAALRRIRVEFTGYSSFGGVVVAGTDLLVATGAPSLGPQVLMLSDSYGDGANGVNAHDTYAVQLGKLLSADMWIDAQGGTGLVNTQGGAGKTNYQPRIVAAASESRLRPDIVLLQGSVNDPATGLATALATAIATCRSQWPPAKVVVTGICYPRAPSSANGLSYATANAALRSGGNGVADLFIDPYFEAWFTGSASASSPSGNGNADIFMSSDGIHGTPAFHALLAAMFARRITDYALTL